MDPLGVPAGTVDGYVHGRGGVGPTDRGPDLEVGTPCSVLVWLSLFAASDHGLYALPGQFRGFIHSSCAICRPLDPAKPPTIDLNAFYKVQVASRRTSARSCSSPSESSFRCWRYRTRPESLVGSAMPTRTSPAFVSHRGSFRWFDLRFFRSWALQRLSLCRPGHS